MSAWIAVLGTLGGVAIGGATSWLIESQRWNRSKSTRWYDERKAVYVQFLVKANAVNDGINNASGIRDRDLADREIASVLRTLEELAPIQAEIGLIGGKAVEGAGSTAVARL